VSKLGHANVLGTIDARPMTWAEAITEYSRGQTLDALLGKASLLLRILVDVLRGLDALHRSALRGNGRPS
jgi:hypothetical protein